MRNRVDITEVEAGTKIRAKYLRALENEEWDLLPGPTFVKTFLRSYADYLGLDSRLLVEEYKQRFERPVDDGAHAVRAARRRRARAASGGGAGSSARRSWSLVGIVALLGALYALGTWGGDDNGGRVAEHDRRARPRRPRRPPRARSRRKPAAPTACHPADRAHRDRQRLPRRRGGRRADQQRDPAGGRADPALPRPPLPRHLRQRPGADARRRPHDRRAGPLDAGRLRAAARQAPARAARGAAADLLSERAGHPHHRHRGAVGDHLRPQRAVAVRAPARARRRGREHPDRGRPPRATCAPRSTSWRPRASTSSSPAAASARPPTT